MIRLIVTVAAVLATGSIATAERHGSRGTMTAYELDGRTVIDHRVCLSSGRHSYDYSRCGSRLRDDVKRKLCNRLGGGTHHYLVQIGDGRPNRTSVFCSRSRY